VTGGDVCLSPCAKVPEFRKLAGLCRVVVLFSGGDAPGMNALLRAVVRLGRNRYEADVLGGKDGYAGLVRSARRLESGELTLATLSNEIDTHHGLEGVGRATLDLVRLDQASVSGLLCRGGIMLGSSRCPEFRQPEVRRSVIDLLERLGVGAVIVCGGAGSLLGAAHLALESSLQVVGIPATIDNDLEATEVALGFDSAVNTLAWAVGHVADTAINHHRIMVLEVMGQNSGALARLAALASGAEIVVTPERGPLTEARMLGIGQRLERAMHKGRRHAIVLVAEGVALDRSLGTQGPASATVWLAPKLQAFFRRAGSPFPEVEARASVLGHLQRGGAPSCADRILAVRFAAAAWQAIASPLERSGVLGVRGGEILLQDFQATPDLERAETAQQLYQLQKDVSRW
jgi:6-phosphofructokinase 1